MQSDLCFKRLTLAAGLRINQREERAEIVIQASTAIRSWQKSSEILKVQPKR